MPDHVAHAIPEPSPAPFSADLRSADSSRCTCDKMAAELGVDKTGEEELKKMSCADFGEFKVN